MIDVISDQQTVICDSVNVFWTSVMSSCAWSTLSPSSSVVTGDVYFKTFFLCFRRRLHRGLLFAVPPSWKGLWHQYEWCNNSSFLATVMSFPSFITVVSEVRKYRFQTFISIMKCRRLERCRLYGGGFLFKTGLELDSISPKVSRLSRTGTLSECLTSWVFVLEGGPWLCCLRPVSWTLKANYSWKRREIEFKLR